MNEHTPAPSGLNFAEFDKLRHTLNATSRFTSASLGSATVTGRNVRMLPVHTPGHRLCGASSDAMTSYAFGIGPRPRTPGTPIHAGSLSFTGEECGIAYPYDAADLGACHETLRLAIALNATGVPELSIPPEALERMREVFTEFWQWVVAGVNRYGIHVHSTEHNPLPAPVLAATTAN